VDGSIVWREELLDQLTVARSAILRHKPEAIVTLGGDCLIDLAPIAYLSESSWNWLPKQPSGLRGNLKLELGRRDQTIAEGVAPPLLFDFLSPSPYFPAGIDKFSDRI